MKIINRNSLRRGGFAGLRETRMVMSPRVFGSHRESGTSAGIGRFVYLADARFMPLGDTRTHTHKEIDVISLMVEGRIRHEGSLEHGQELLPNTVQVQRAGGEGFSHNEINPDDAKNRMIQLWVLPETPDEPAAYQMFDAKPGMRTRVYGGPADQQEPFPSRTLIDIARLGADDTLEQPGKCLVYIVSGTGTGNEQDLFEGYLVETSDFNFKASTECMLIVASEA